MEKAMFEAPSDFRPDFSKSGGLVAAIAQDARTKDVLMLAWMNEEAWDLTLRTGEAHYWSRSRQKLWHKGESSGNVQKVLAVRLDCDSRRMPHGQGQLLLPAHLAPEPEC